MKLNPLHKNVALWAAVDPKHAVLLPYCEDPLLMVCETELHEPNLNKGENFYHSASGALKEAEKWFSTLPLKDISILYIYGIGLGYQYDVVKPWLKANRKRHVVFLEDDLSVIYRFFETDRGSRFLKDSRAHLYYFQDIDSVTKSLELLLWHFMKAKIFIDALPFYKKAKGEKFEALQHEIVRQTVKHCTSVDEYLKYGASFYRNFYNNMRLISQSYYGNHFFGQFQGVPAIICGAGPSLEKNAHLLRELNDRALIFAGGSAMNSLNSKGIIPHFGAGIDPNAPQYDRVLANTAYEVPYFYRNRMFWKAFRLLHGPRLYISGSGGYEVSKVFDDAFGFVEEELDEGHNVVNFCVEIANRMGCNPIIFVGVDLAFTEMQAYAEGIIAERGFKEEIFTTAEDLDELPVERKDIYGNKIYTLWKWIEEADWIANYAKENPKLQLINATEGGLGFPGVQNLALEAIPFKEAFDLAGRIHGETQNCPHVTENKVLEVMQDLRDSLKRCLEHLTVLLNENQRLQQMVKDNEKIETMQTGLSVLAETELEDEMAYPAILEVFGAIASLLLNYEFRNLKRSRNPELKRLQLNEKKLKYVSQAAAFNLVLLEDSLKENPEYARE